jgi:hypothetical protein
MAPWPLLGSHPCQKFLQKWDSARARPPTPVNEYLLSVGVEPGIRQMLFRYCLASKQIRNAYYVRQESKRHKRTL